MWAFAKALDPAVWLKIAIGFAIGVVLVVVYHAGGNAPRAQLKAFQAETAAVANEQIAREAKKAEVNAAYIAALDKEHADHIATINAGWTAELDRLRKYPGRSPAPKPVPIVARVCDNEDGNQRLSDAIQLAESKAGEALTRFQSSTDAGINDYQANVGRLLEVADRQAAELNTCKAWAVTEQKMQGEP